ncbi:C/D box methylation guide ribonucleoprotein complex aNOP56 subunit [Thermogladius sp. 4427co]|uniref:C/D box methylation guide ribonucleoprotein complex aNOP56 subunit n=1 Tax=Thermogladius sp. 4427co TaxID=3450718 RepID=UPI003F7A03B9
MANIYFTQNVVGAFAIDEEGHVIASSFSPFKSDEIIDYLLDIEEGRMTQQAREVMDKLKSMGYKEVYVENMDDAKIASSLELTPRLEAKPLPIVRFREQLPKIAVENNLVASEEEYYNRLHEISLELTRRKLRKEAQKRDLLAVQSIRAIDDIDKTINLYVSRLREWYSIHFPELDELVKDHELYARLVYELGDRENYSPDKLKKLGLGGDMVTKITEAAKKSIGADLSDFDIEYIRKLAGVILDLYELRETLEGYIDAVMKEVAPNITAIVGSKLGARLLSLAGSLEELAKLPASTIQVLGAEKALFRALRTGGKPPKHGVIFQYPAIHKSPRWQRGKIARALAAKLAIAAKVDYYSGRYIGDKLVKELEERIEEIKKLYPKPPPKKPEEAKTEKKGRKREREKR